MTGDNSVRLGVLTMGLVVQAGVLAACWGFVADDAYIVARYADNLVADGELWFNRGEHVLAVTSPLHLGLAAAVSALGLPTILGTRVAALAVLAAALALVVARVWYRAPALALFVALVLCSPFLALWTCGGLETPLLVAWVLGLGVAFPRFRAAGGALDGALVLGLAALCVLTRYDACLLVLPVAADTVWRAWRSRTVTVLVAAVVAGVLCAAWLTFALWTFGDLLPTSAYVKSPVGSLQGAVMGALVVVDFLALTGLGLLGVLGLGWWVLDDGVRGAVVSRVRAQRPLWIGWGLYVLAYGSLASAQHMMFGFRLLLPGLALAALLLADLAQHVPLVGPGRSRPRTAFWAALAVVMVLQLSGAVVLRFASVNPTRVGEYQHLAVTEYDTLFMDHLDEVARAIDEHWASTATAGERAPRVHTFAAGKLPYLLDEAYVFEELISYRHDCRDVDLNAAADYVHLMRSAADEALKPGAGEVIWSARSGFPGCVECGVEWVVLYNPSPSPNPLPPTTHGPCVFDQARR